MSDLKTEIQFTLDRPIDIDYNGEKTEAKMLVLKAPSNKVRANRARLKEGFLQAINENAREAADRVQVESSEDKKQEIIKDEDLADYVVMMLYGSKTVSIVDMLEEFKNLLIHGKCCKVEGEVELTNLLFEKMDAEDTDRLLGEYLAAFILASFLKKIQTT